MPQLPGLPPPPDVLAGNKVMQALLGALTSKCECETCLLLRDYAVDLKLQLGKK